MDSSDLEDVSTILLSIFITGNSTDYSINV